MEEVRDHAVEVRRRAELPPRPRADEVGRHRRLQLALVQLHREQGRTGRVAGRVLELEAETDARAETPVRRRVDDEPVLELDPRDAHDEPGALEGGLDAGCRELVREPVELVLPRRRAVPPGGIPVPVQHPVGFGPGSALRMRGERRIAVEGLRERPAVELGVRHLEERGHLEEARGPLQVLLVHPDRGVVGEVLLDADERVHGGVGRDDPARHDARVGADEPRAPHDLRLRVDPADHEAELGVAPRRVGPDPLAVAVGPPAEAALLPLAPVLVHPEGLEDRADGRETRVPRGLLHHRILLPSGDGRDARAGR